MITGGMVAVEDGTKKSEEYVPPRKVRVELTFAVPEGHDAQALFDMVARAADAKVRELLGQTIVGTQSTAAEVATVTPAKATRSKKAIPAEPATQTEAVVTVIPPGKPAPIQVVLKPETANAASMDEFAADEPVAEVKEVTDRELHEAMTRKASELGGNAVPIKKLVGEYRPAGSTGQFTSAQIPQPKRGEFLAKLKELKAA